MYVIYDIVIRSVFLRHVTCEAVSLLRHFCASAESGLALFTLPNILTHATPTRRGHAHALTLHASVSSAGHIIVGRRLFTS